MPKKKVKISSSDAVVGSGGVYSPSMCIDFDDVAEVKGLSIGDTVRIVIKGTVRSIDQRESYDDPKAQTASISIKDFESEIVPESTQFDGLLSDEDD